MKLVSYNVNGIRAAMNKGLVDWLAENDFDVVCFQEIKALEEQIDVEALKALGYDCHWFSAEKKGYSGTGILTRVKPDQVIKGCGIDAYDAEGRTLMMDFGDTRLVNTYFPSGSSGELRQDFKMEFLDQYLEFINGIGQPRVIHCGDYNICHTASDIHDPVRNKDVSGFKPEERAWMDKYFSSGHIDTFRVFHKGELHRYSWWSYRAGARRNNKGWRIDYISATENMRDQLIDADILDQAVHSDHCPIYLEFKHPA